MSGFYVYSRNREQVFGEFGTNTTAALDTRGTNTRRGHVAISVRLKGLHTLNFVLHCQMQSVELYQ